MRWALKRQFIYALAVLVALGLIAVGSWFALFYHAPTCFDGQKNGDETGVDCGGSCARLCAAPSVTAVWARAVLAAPGVYHAVALVRNPDPSAGTTALPYHFSLYDGNNILVAERSGVMSLQPGDLVPLFEPDIVTGNRVPVRTFIEFGNAVWSKMDRTQNPFSVSSQNFDAQNLTLTAHVENTTALPIPHAIFTALLYGADGNVINASQTALDAIPPHGGKDIIFTWQQPFSDSVVRFEITPQVQ